MRRVVRSNPYRVVPRRAPRPTQRVGLFRMSGEKKKIDPKIVMSLKNELGLSMIKVKEALEQANGDIGEAKKILMAQGAKIAAKRQGKTAAYGRLDGCLLVPGQAAYLIGFSAETDFALSSDVMKDFFPLLQDLISRHRPADMNALLKQEFDASSAGSGETVESYMTNVVTARLGEKIQLDYYDLYEAGANGYVHLYVHHMKDKGVLVELSALDQTIFQLPQVQEFVKSLGHHISYAAPHGIREEDISETTVRERTELAELSTDHEVSQRASHSQRVPIDEELKKRIRTGKLQRSLGDLALLEQVWVRDSKKKVGQVMREINPTLKVVRFVRHEYLRG